MVVPRDVFLKPGAGQMNIIADIEVSLRIGLMIVIYTQSEVRRSFSWLWEVGGLYNRARRCLGMA